MKIIRDDLSKANSISFMDMGLDIEGVTSEIDSFLSAASTQLSGEGFEKILNSIKSQNEGLKKYANYIQNFDAKIIYTTNKMSQYMNPYSELDDAQKFEVYTLIDGLKRTNSGLEWQINHPNLDSEGNPTVNVDSLRDRIESNNAQITELDKKYKLLDGLAAEDSSNASIIDSFFSHENLAAFALDTETFNFN